LPIRLISIVGTDSVPSDRFGLRFASSKLLVARNPF
jgi:hypothetical protein